MNWLNRISLLFFYSTAAICGETTFEHTFDDKGVHTKLSSLEKEITNMFVHDLTTAEGEQLILGYCTKQQAYCFRHKSNTDALPIGFEWYELRLISSKTGYFLGVPYGNAESVALLPFWISNARVSTGQLRRLPRGKGTIFGLRIQAQGYQVPHRQSILQKAEKDIFQAGRSYGLAVFSQATGELLTNTTFDVYGNAQQASRLAETLNNQNENHVIVLLTYDEPQYHRTNALKQAIRRCGGGPVFEYPNFQYRSAYILIGICSDDESQRMGYEFYAGDKSSDPKAALDIPVSIISDQIIVPDTCERIQKMAKTSQTGIYTLQKPREPKRLVRCQFDASGKVTETLLKTNMTGMLQLPRSCLDYLQDNSELPSGTYSISLSNNKVIPVYCDMEKGGWMVFQRRKNGSVDFYQNWEAYKQGFPLNAQGEIKDLMGEFWLGNETLHALTKNAPWELRIDMKAPKLGKSAYAQYAAFQIESEQNGYRLKVSGYSGNARDSLSYHNNHQFSTKYRDNDTCHSNCADDSQGAWWYGCCHTSSLNGAYKNGFHKSNGDGAHWDGIAWDQRSSSSHHYSIPFIEMKVRPHRALPVSCLDLHHREPDQPSGIYRIQPVGSNAFSAYCDMERDGGGWTLVLQALGDRTLTYDSPYWTNKKTLNADTKYFLQKINAKFSGFATIPVREIRGCLDGHCFTFGCTKDTKNNKQEEVEHCQLEGKTLLELFKSGIQRGVAGHPGFPKPAKKPWSTQPNCQHLRINNKDRHYKIRFGYTANQENDCRSNDTAIGFGVFNRFGAGYVCRSTQCSLGNVEQGTFGTLWVR
jgi:ficolin